MMAIRKKRKTYASHRWRLHLLTGIWGVAVTAAVVVLVVRCQRSASVGITIDEPLLAQICEVQLPDATPDEVVTLDGFTVHFNAVHHIPNYVVYRLLRSHIGGKASYSGTFTCADSVRGCAKPSEYAKSGYQHGHMAPAADMKWSKKALEQSYTMLNICPQRKSLNTGAWQMLEEKVREWAMRDSVLVVFTGPILAKQMPTIGKTSKIAVPGQFFKVVFAPYARPSRAIAFVMPNADADKLCSEYAVSVAEVERLTGFDFFSTLPDAEQCRLESGVDADSWFQF